MDYKNSEVIFKRFNSAAYDLALAEIASLKNEEDSYVKHKRDAGEAISQSFEFALKHHINLNLQSSERRLLDLNNSNIAKLIEKYVDDNWEDNGYLYRTVNDFVEPSVDFKFLLQNKSKITNAAKHKGQDPDIEIQKKYFEEVRKFISQYIDENEKLKTIEDFKNIDLSTWDLLYSACDRFYPEERNYILIIGPNRGVDNQYLKNLSIPKWNMIIDFDYDSLTNGFFDLAYGDREVPPHIMKASDLIDVNSFSRFSQVHYHYFVNNFKGSGESEPKDYTEWSRKHGKNTEFFLKSFSDVLSNQKNIVVILYDSRRYINFICEKIEQYLGTNTSFIFANDVSGDLSLVCDDFNGVKVNISIPEMSEGLSNFSSNFGIINPNKGQILIPFMEKTTTETSGILTPSEFAQLEEYFEVVHKGLPTNEPENEQLREEFLNGESKISWFGLKNRFDVERPNFHKKFVKPIEKVIENGRGKIQLIHEAGFGGSTVARRIAWEIHNDYPTLILKKYRDVKVKESLIMLHEKTRKSIFVIMEVPQTITLDEVDSLYKSIPQTRPIVFLIVKRGKPKSNDLVVSDWGNDTSDLVNAYKAYISDYILETKNKKEKELNEIIFSQDSYKKTPFYVGLLTFEEKFFAIKDFIKKFVLEVLNKEEQKRVLIYLAICDDYLGQGLPSQFFKKLFKISDLEIINLEEYFSQDSSIITSLLTSNQEGNYKFWRIRHNFFAKELKMQILSGNSENPEIWRQGLADLCVKFIEDSISDFQTSEYIEEVLQKLFIGNRKDRAGEDFTAIINDTDSIEGKEQIFIALKENYPDNPHYCSHLARFYAYHNKNSEKALQYADEAIRLSEIQGTQDSLLYHIKGMCLRSIAYDEMSRQRKILLQGVKVSYEDYDFVIDKLVPEAAIQFELAREIAKKQNRLDEYGFIAHIQLLISAIDYAIIFSGKTKANFFKQNIDPFSDWLDLSESLLEEVKRINLDNDESGKIENCVNDIMAFYEDYEQILQNLRSQLEKGKNPSRTRRQIVRTYFRKKEDYTKDAKTINNILQLMEQNIDNEPDNEKNFYLWFQAARYSTVSIEDSISKMSKWKSNSGSIDAIYYFYILKVFRALQGYSDATIDAYNLIRECKSKGKSNISILEWYGKGSGLNKFVNRGSIAPDNKDEKLELVNGYFTEYVHDGSGKITILDKLEVFFSPTQAKLTSNDLNKPVEFYLGFSYDGLRADSFSVRIKGAEPRNIEPYEEFTIENVKTAHNEIALNEKIKALKVLNTISVPESRKKDVKKNNEVLRGEIITMQRPPIPVMGDIKSTSGETYFFHKNNEDKEVFAKLKIGTKVTFELTNNDTKGIIATNIKIVEQ